MCSVASATALGITLEGDRDLLGLWFPETEGAKFWTQILVYHEALLNRMEAKTIIAWPSQLLGWS